ncbi:hypothetical protein PRIPAC_76835 [Pristionchus pacificus]|uniref:Uncharacterized protein n=1 Tax=Pristionchus pacificus TaxID=54126 RepID=A0A2A6CPF2_PRIPA|nr:hypothetical protein PRIPAC_76835 [Pristionchus pacificus]|eukprot:PDM79947.1 hypothetical protein PRIPAC_32526 [Pristionchus pacificus]
MGGVNSHETSKESLICAAKEKDNAKKSDAKRPKTAHCRLTPCARSISVFTGEKLALPVINVQSSLAISGECTTTLHIGPNISILYENITREILGWIVRGKFKPASQVAIKSNKAQNNEKNHGLNGIVASQPSSGMSKLELHSSCVVLIMVHPQKLTASMTARGFLNSNARFCSAVINPTDSTFLRKIRRIIENRISRVQGRAL